jgi:serine/threonine protein kinase
MPEVNERSLGNFFCQMLSGISHCHQAKVIHRDIVPDHFLVAGRDNQLVKLADFRLASLISQEERHHSIAGTVPYMCPEMLLGQGYDTQADVWSFGVIVYVMLFGVFPYAPTEKGPSALRQLFLDDAVHPSFQPVRRNSSCDHMMRSDSAVDLAKALLMRNAEHRPTAKAALRMTWMMDSKRDHHLQGFRLPSLRDMIPDASTVGFTDVTSWHVQNPLGETAVDALSPASKLDPAVRDTDTLLKQLQEERHGNTEYLLKELLVSSKLAPSVRDADLLVELPFTKTLSSPPPPMSAFCASKDAPMSRNISSPACPTSRKGSKNSSQAMRINLHGFWRSKEEGHSNSKVSCSASLDSSGDITGRTTPTFGCSSDSFPPSKSSRKAFSDMLPPLH